jgi:hypothetical protein
MIDINKMSIQDISVGSELKAFGGLGIDLFNDLITAITKQNEIANETATFIATSTYALKQIIYALSGEYIVDNDGNRILNPNWIGNNKTPEQLEKEIYDKGIEILKETGELAIENLAQQTFVEGKNEKFVQRLKHVNLGSNHANRILNTAIDDVEKAVEETEKVIKFIKNRKDNINKGKKEVKDRIKDIFSKRHLNLSHNKTLRIILISAGVIFVHIIIHWACSKIGISVVLGWFITLLTGGFGLFYLIFKALEENRYERMMKKDSNYYNDIDYCGDMDSNCQSMSYNSFEDYY